MKVFYSILIVIIGIVSIYYYTYIEPSVSSKDSNTSIIAQKDDEVFKKEKKVAYIQKNSKFRIDTKGVKDDYFTMEESLHNFQEQSKIVLSNKSKNITKKISNVVKNDNSNYLLNNGINRLNRDNGIDRIEDEKGFLQKKQEELTILDRDEKVDSNKKSDLSNVETKTNIINNGIDSKNIAKFNKISMDNSISLDSNVSDKNISKVSENSLEDSFIRDFNKSKNYTFIKKSKEIIKNDTNETKEETKIKSDISIIDNDTYDPDYIPLLLSAIYENKNKNVNVGLIIVSEDGLSDKTNMLYRSILEEFNSEIPLTISHNTNDRSFRSKLLNNIENYSYTIKDSELEDASITLENTLEEQEDKSVSYLVGGKLIFLSKFLSEPDRLELFKLKVKKIIFGLGCNPLDKECKQDFNLASTNKALLATKDIYSKLHNQIPFVVIDDKRGKGANVRSLDLFKNSDIPLMKHLLSTNIYGTYGDHNLGDIEILFSESRVDNFEQKSCNVVFENNSFKAKSIDKGGNDYILINRDLNIGQLTRDIFQSLIDSKKNL